MNFAFALCAINVLGSVGGYMYAPQDVKPLGALLGIMLVNGAAAAVLSGRLVSLKRLRSGPSFNRDG